MTELNLRKVFEVEKGSEWIFTQNILKVRDFYKKSVTKTGPYVKYAILCHSDKLINQVLLKIEVIFIKNGRLLIQPDI
jgi:hypothetical protein